MQHTLTLNVKVCSIPGPRGKIRDSGSVTMCEIVLSFIWHQFCQKILRNAAGLAIWKKKSRKTNFARGRIPQIRQKVENFIFNIFEDKCHTNILRPKYDILVVKWSCGGINKLEKAKTDIRLVPPPLN